MSESKVLTYEKCCVICYKVYLTKRMGTMYCSKKCSNKARNFPAAFLMKMADKAMQTVRIIEGPNKATREAIQRFGLNNFAEHKEAEAAAQLFSLLPNVSASDAKETVEQALKIKQQLDERQRNSQQDGVHKLADNSGTPELGQPEMTVTERIEALKKQNMKTVKLETGGSDENTIEFDVPLD